LTERRDSICSGNILHHYTMHPGFSFDIKHILGIRNVLDGKFSSIEPSLSIAFTLSLLLLSLLSQDAKAKPRRIRKRSFFMCFYLECFIDHVFIAELISIPVFIIGKAFYNEFFFWSGVIIRQDNIKWTCMAIV